LGSNLPNILRRHAAGIEALRTGTQDKLAELEALYCGIIWDALGDRPAVLLLDDIGKLDMQSLGVLRRMADRARAVQPHPGLKSRSMHSAVICTSRSHNLLGMGKALKAVAHPLATTTRLSLLLPPLDNAAVVEIARRSLGSSLAEPIAALVVGE
jgi:predicted ATPase